MSMDEAIQPDYLILPIDEHHWSGFFKSGAQEFLPLKTFLQKEAVKFKRGYIAQTYIIIDDNERVGRNKPVLEYHR